MKGVMFTIYKHMQTEHKRLDNQIESIKEQLKHMPPGKLICMQNGKYSKWSQSDGHTKSNIPKKNRKLAETLAVKKYFTALLEDLEKEKNAIEFYLRHSSPNGKAEKLLSEPSEYQKLLAPHFMTKSEELFKWMSAPYEQNMQYPEQRNMKCISGNLVRSKLESMIDMSLYVHHIPFRYECALTLGDKTIYPDFTIRHPQSGQLYYWEHFGLMDHPAYYKNAYDKLQLYTEHGIIPTHQLITTYETKDYPLQADTIEKTIEQYFLS